MDSQVTCLKNCGRKRQIKPFCRNKIHPVDSDTANEKSGQQSLSTLTLGWWQTGCYGSGGKSVWAAALWQDIAAKAEDLPAKVQYGEPHIPKSHANEERQNHEQVNQAARKGDDIPTI